MFTHFVQEIEGVAKIKDGYNPATWMLEVTTVSQELVLGVDFSDIYKNSELYQSVTYFQPLLLPAYKNCKCDF
jgi:hypothetical protein